MASWTYRITSAYVYNHYELLGNALNVKNYLTDQGLTEAAIIGIIANMEHESFLNPGQQEHGYGGDPSRGYGLVQWTPANAKILPYAASVGGNWYNGDLQMDYLMISVPQGWQMHMHYTWEQYKQLTDVNLATRVFFRNFEIGTWTDALYRYASYWDYELYGHIPPTPPVPPRPHPDPTDDEFISIFFSLLTTHVI